MRYSIALVVMLTAAGCSAEFTDLRPGDAAEQNNLTTNNPTGNNGVDASDAGTMTDSSRPDANASDSGPTSETLIATGDFVNVDYETEGSAQYWQLGDGSYEVRLSMDFASQGVPGPALALSPRNPLGGSVAADELDLGALTTDAGAQSYALPGNPADFAFAWIWCKPFGLDVAYAEMEFQ
jgi:hypothetical protein